jgi:hypothetical protein
MEIIDYRVGTGSDEERAAAAEKYEKYVGDYKHPAGGDPFKVLVQDGSLAVDIPNKMVLGFSDPDEDDRWYCKLSSNLFCTFDEDEDGKVVSFSLHEMIPAPRKTTPEEIGDDVPEDLKPYMGEFNLAQLNAVFTFSCVDGGLAVHNSLDGETVKLQPPNEKGGWVDEYDKNVIYFERDDDGVVTSMTIEAISTFEK